MTRLDPDAPPTQEEKIWTWVAIAINVAILAGVIVMVPVFRKAAIANGVPHNYRLVFYAVAVLAVGNAIRRVILQWSKLKRRGRNDS